MKPMAYTTLPSGIVIALEPPTPPPAPKQSPERDFGDPSVPEAVWLEHDKCSRGEREPVQFEVKSIGDGFDPRLHCGWCRSHPVVGS